MVKTRLIYALLVATATLGSFVLTNEATAQRVELLDFYLPTCGPCHAMAPTIDRLSQEGIAVRKIDGSRDVALTQQMRVDSYPTFIAVIDGREIGRITGGTDYANLQKLLTTAQQRAGAAASPAAPVAGSPQTFAAANPGQAANPAAQLTAADPTLTASLIESSVRIVIDEPNGRSFGTGTVIDARQGEALVVTCAHLFRDAQGKLIPTEGRVTLELFAANGSAPAVVERVAGRLVSYDMEADVALVSLRPTRLLTPVPIADASTSVAAGAPVMSVGCDLGANPTLRTSKVVSLNRYHGSANIETTGAPIQGRSGGGLFNATGELVGICYAADEELDEGLYAGLAPVYAELDRVGLSELYLPGTTGADTLIASNTPPNPFASDTGSQMTPVSDSSVIADAAVQPTSWPDPIVRGQNAGNSELSLVERATLDEVVRRGAKSEVVLLIRSNEPGGQTEVLTLDAASPEFVATLRRMGQAGSLPPSR